MEISAEASTQVGDSKPFKKSKNSKGDLRISLFFVFRALKKFPSETDKYSMKKLFVLFFLISCAHEPQRIEKPSWVAAVRSGEATLKAHHGSKIYFRRIAGGANVSKQTSCELVVYKAEEDIKREYPLMPKVSYAVEVLFYDEEHKDCAVTLSVNGDTDHRHADLGKFREIAAQRKDEILAKENVSDDDATELLQLRSENAIRYALTGLTRNEFEKFSREPASVIEGSSLCSQVFKTEKFSIHGTTHICWQGETIQGYCTIKDKQCWNRTP